MTTCDSFYLRTFHEKSLYLLEENDREILHNVLKEYQQYHDVARLVAALTIALDSPQKLDLLKDLRGLIPMPHLPDFDRLAPYARMANPFRPPKVKAKRQPQAWGQRQHLLNGINIDSLEQMGNMLTLKLERETNDDSLGFTIRGGSEHGLGIFVSQVEQGSRAETSGLCVGDQIMEVNNVSLHNISSSTALHILADSYCLRIVIKRLGKVPGFKFAKEKTAWYDVTRHRIVQGSLNDHGTYQYPSNKRMLTSNEFRVHLRLSSSQAEFGFNIRGGSEYGLGIFISSVDPGGLAESRGLKPGQQLVDVNGIDFESICHALAVEIIRSHRQLVLTMRDVGRYPAYKELYAKFSWHSEAAVSAGDNWRGRARSHEDLPSASAGSLRRHLSTGSTPSVRSLRDFSTARNLEPLAVEVWENKGTQTSRFPGEAAWPEDDDVTLVNRETNMSSTLRRGQTERSNLLQRMTVPQPLDSSVERSVRDQFGTTSPARSSVYSSISEEHIMPHHLDAAPSILSAQKDRALVVSDSVPALLRPSEMPLRGQVRLKAFRLRSDPGAKLDRSPSSGEEETKSEHQGVSPIEESMIESPNSGGENNCVGPASVRRRSTFREKLFGREKKSYKLGRKSKAKDGAPRWDSSLSSGGGILARLGVRMRRQRSEDNELSARQRRDIEAEVAFNNNDVKTSSYRRRDINELAVEEMARKLFSKGDRKQMLRHVTEYASGQANVESLTKSVLPLLAKPEHVLILRELRGVLRDTDVGRFDSMVGPTEVTAYEELASRKAAKSAKLSPNSQSEGPPKKMLMEPVPDNRGHYYLQTPEEFKLDQERRLEIERLRKEKEKAKRSPRPAVSAQSKLYLKRHEGKKAVRIRDAPADIEVIPNSVSDQEDSVSDLDDANTSYDIVSFSRSEEGCTKNVPSWRDANSDPQTLSKKRSGGGRYAVVRRRPAPKLSSVHLADSFASTDIGLGGESATETGESSNCYEVFSAAVQSSPTGLVLASC